MPELREPPAVERDGGLGGVRRRRAADGGDVVEQRTVGVVTDGGDHGTLSSATVRQSVSSQKQSRSASEPPPRATITTSTARQGGEVAEGADDRRRRMAILHRRKAPDEAPRPAASGKRGEQVVARLAALGRDHADRARQGRQRQTLLQLEQPLGVERLAQAVDPREQVALAGDAQVGDTRTKSWARRWRFRGSSRSRPR